MYGQLVSQCTPAVIRIHGNRSALIELLTPADPSVRPILHKRQNMQPALSCVAPCVRLRTACSYGYVRRLGHDEPQIPTFLEKLPSPSVHSPHPLDHNQDRDTHLADRRTLIKSWLASTGQLGAGDVFAIRTGEDTSRAVVEAARAAGFEVVEGEVRGAVRYANVNLGGLYQRLVPADFGWSRPSRRIIKRALAAFVTTPRETTSDARRNG